MLGEFYQSLPTHHLYVMSDKCVWETVWPKKEIVAAAGEVLTRYALWQKSDRPPTKQALVAFFRIGEQPVWVNCVILPVTPSFGGSERLPTARACATCAAVIAVLSDFETLNI